MKYFLCSIVLMAGFTAHGEDYLFNHTNPRGQNYLCRLASARGMTLMQDGYVITDEHNGDDQNVADYAGSFHKTLEHDSVTGLLTDNGSLSYEQLLRAIKTALQADFNAIVRAPGATTKLVSPQAAFELSLAGVPNAIVPIPSAPILTSAHAAAEMIEVYLKAICRDVHFTDYGTGANTDVDTVNGGSITNNAAAILTDLGDAYKGPSVNGVVTAGTLFRGTSAGDLVGPYASQFVYLSVQNHYDRKQYVRAAQQREFGVAWSDFVAIENGIVPKPYDQYDFGGDQYIIKGRDIGTLVHSDIPGEFHMNAITALLGNGAPLLSIFPYENGSMPNEDAFVNMTGPDIYAIIVTITKEALKHAWAHKWQGNRRLRPEAMAGLVHRAKITDNNEFNLDQSLFDIHAGIDLLAWVKGRNEQQASLAHNALPLAEAQTYLLALMYPEGSPSHPSYPAGHAVVAGACSTVAKAFFDDTALLHEFLTPVKPDPSDPTQLVPLSNGEGAQLITIGGEFDKLASNIAIARNIAGVHYRSDGDEGIELGEQLAINFLQDWGRMYSESGFTGFELTKRNGVRVRITPDAVTVINA